MTSQDAALGEVCSECGLPIPWQDEVWMTPDGHAAGPPVGDPFHVECAPDERNP